VTPAVSCGDLPFLRVPPFPGHKGTPLTQVGGSDVDAKKVMAAICAARVGGTFWGAQPDMADDIILLVPDTEDQLRVMLALLGKGQASAALAPAMQLPSQCQRLDADCDPWHLASAAREIWAGADQELSLIHI
jgi:capsular polysaccharide export protein